LLAVLIAVGTFAGLLAAARRFHVEMGNRRVELALEWTEVSNLAQMNPQRVPLPAILERFKAQGVSTLVIVEDTLASLEQAGAIRRTDSAAEGLFAVENQATLARIRAALALRGLPVNTLEESEGARGTRFLSAPWRGGAQRQEGIFVPIEYANLRTLGLGLPPEAVAAAKAAGLRIAGRIGNFPGVSPTSAANALNSLRAQGATTVIFTGDDVLGYRGIEKEVAADLKASAAKPEAVQIGAVGGASPLTYGAVEFGKQKGDEKLTAALKGDYVRVHSIQAAEMGQLDENEAVDRFVRAARERNIRFCYVRLFTFAGEDPVGANVEYVKKIARGIAKGGAFTGGGLEFGAARPFAETGVPSALFVLVALGVAAGAVWMARLFCPLARRLEVRLLIALCVLCVGLALLGETGRKLVALLAGIAFPAAACLKTFPRPEPDLLALAANSSQAPGLPGDRAACLRAAVRGLALASAITALGIVPVIGLLATRPFMLHASQFLGIKAQHAVPLLLVALAATLGGAAAPGETWKRYCVRAAERLRLVWNEPARIGLLLLGLLALAGLALVVARTGNDPGVGVSGFELKGRALLDRLLPVRPRTKEFLIGHPAFILGLAWWWRGRRRLAIPCFVVGSLGQVSLLNTFCHIHTPLLISAWRDGLGLILGTLLGMALFLLLEFVMPPPSDVASITERAVRPPFERAGSRE
jgi:hypothetical protein